jgi:hypothetical protein
MKRGDQNSLLESSNAVDERHRYNLVLKRSRNCGFGVSTSQFSAESGICDYAYEMGKIRDEQ